MLQQCLDNQRPVVEKLDATVMETLRRSGQTKSPMYSKLCELNDVYEQTLYLAQQRRNELLDKLQQVISVHLLLFSFSNFAGPAVNSVSVLTAIFQVDLD